MLQSLTPFLENVAGVIDLIGILIAVFGALKFLFHAVPVVFVNPRGVVCATQIRHLRVELGTYIILAFEFMIVSDIINTVLTQTLEDLAFLGGLVVIRTAVGFFLGKEIEALGGGKAAAGKKA